MAILSRIARGDSGATSDSLPMVPHYSSLQFPIMTRGVVKDPGPTRTRKLSFLMPQSLLRTLTSCKLRPPTWDDEVFAAEDQIDRH